MAGDENFYPGTDYGLDSGFQEEVTIGAIPSYAAKAGQIGITLDARTANQLKEVAGKLSTGAKTIEVQGVMPDVIDSIPRQHFKEINRLKKLTGVDLTFHGPVIEPTGIGQQGNWDPNLREQAETKIWSAVDRAQALEPDGNLIVTFHSSNGLPEPRSQVKTADGKIIDSGLGVIDERTGKFGVLPRAGKDYLEDEEGSAEKELEKLNKENWSTNLSNVNISASRGRDVFERVGILDKSEKEKNATLEIYKKYLKGDLKEADLEKLDIYGKDAMSKINELSYGDVFVKDSYSSFKNLFNQAYDSAERSKNEDEVKKLEKLRKEILPVIKEYEGDASKVVEMANAVTKGIRVLDSIETPKTFRPLKDFAVDKASETFSNVALKAYKKYGDHAPIISIENPPAGSGLSRAEDLRDLIKATRKKFINQLVDKEGLSKDRAEYQAEKLIGATWDVGHINMIRGMGFTEKDVIAESEKIAPYVKHVHLSDNFGLEHTELPMGMGNVPMKEILKLSKNFQKAKKIIETGQWYQHFQTSPLTPTLRAFGSPIYSMQMGPTWSGQSSGMPGQYWTGYGQTLPEQHFNMYGAGFSGLPPELGGQMSGTNRLSGAPMQ